MRELPTIDLDAAAQEELVLFVAEIEAMAADEISPHLLPVHEQRAQLEAAAEAPLPHAIDRRIGGVPVRILEPETVHGTYLYIHGGGWTMGGSALQDARLWRYAIGAGVRVVSVEYRLAPEHPFPACLDDCLAVAEEVAGERVVIGGESAGAHLSALVLTRMRDGFAGANLAYGCFDLGMSQSQRAWGERRLVLSTPIIRWHIDQLLPGASEQDRRAPGISPLFADLAGLPPALFTVGTDDPMLDDSLEMARRWPAAELDVYPGGFHAFDFFPLRVGEIANQRQIDFTRRCIGNE